MKTLWEWFTYHLGITSRSFTLTCPICGDTSWLGGLEGGSGQMVECESNGHKFVYGGGTWLSGSLSQ